ncbi:MAG TPA: hypothetical protein VMR77_04020 [Patescibacteria group bacterium]|jgi:hypothetical protein|nr:hypothetical protein [Patescibacteria group bacterium]
MANVGAPEVVAKETPKGLATISIRDLEGAIKKGIVRDETGTHRPIVRLYGRELRSVTRQNTRTGESRQVKYVASTEDPASNIFVDCKVSGYFPHVVRLDVLDENGEHINQAMEITDQNIASLRFRVMPPVLETPK